MVQKRSSSAFKQLETARNWWRQNSPFKEVYDDTINEQTLGLLAFIFSLSVLAAKLVFANRESLYNLIFEKRLIKYETILTDGEVLFTYARTKVWKYSRFWFPAVCGALVTRFTWLMVFLDSSVPGVTPPSPLSPTKYRAQSGHTFHLNYIFAVIIGVAVAGSMYANGIALEF